MLSAQLQQQPPFRSPFPTTTTTTTIQIHYTEPLPLKDSVSDQHLEDLLQKVEAASSPTTYNKAKRIMLPTLAAAINEEEALVQ